MAFRLNFKLLVLILWVFMECTLRSMSEIYVPLHWTPLNPLFKSPTSQVNTSVLKMNVLPKSQLNIICPNTVLNPVKMHQSPDKDNLYENLWIVDKKSFDSCSINSSIKTNRLLLQCNTPLKFKHYPMVFFEISPSVQFLEFQKGKDYYFISTSDGTKKSLKNTRNGHCYTARMKLIIHVCLNEQDPLCQDKPATTTTLKPTTIPTTIPTTLPTTPIPTTRTPSTSTPSTTHQTTTIKTNKPTTGGPAVESVIKRDGEPGGTPTDRKMNSVAGTPDVKASKNERTAAQIARDATWFILMAVMGALLVVSLSCNLYSMCVVRKGHQRSDAVDDKRSSAAHTLLRDNSRVDRV